MCGLVAKKVVFESFCLYDCAEIRFKENLIYMFLTSKINKKYKIFHAKRLTDFTVVNVLFSLYDGYGASCIYTCTLIWKLCLKFSNLSCFRHKNR